MDNNDKGKVAEQLIAKLCEDAFVGNFCFKNPYGDDNKEICDVLVVVEDIAIIWQIKSLKIRTKDNQFKASEIKKAIKQCWGAKRNLNKRNSIDALNLYGIKKQ